jgi:hypothetical protein
MRQLWIAALLAACGPTPSPKLDGGHHPIDTAIAIDMPVPIDAGPYRHTIAIDGVDDFTSAETFGTTSSPGYAARVTWDADNVYVGYSGPDLDPAAANTATKWLFLYVDLDPGTATGALDSATYRTQHAAFPTGFGAELYARYRCDATFAEIDAFAANAWTMTAPLASAHTGTFVELAIPRSLFGGATTIGLVTWMINEQQDLEGSYAGLYPGNFTDGYSAALPLTHYLRADFSLSRTPNDVANQAP